MQQESSTVASDILQTTAATTVVAENNTADVAKSSFTTDTSSSQRQYFTKNPFLSATSTEDLDSSEAYFYSSLLSQSSNYSPSDTSFDDAMADNFATERRLCQASFVLEYQQLYNRYTLCLARLQESMKEVDCFRQENDALRVANADLAQRLSQLSQATIQNCLLSDFNRLKIGNDPPPNIIPNPKSLIDRARIHRQNPPTERVSLPKSISVRSSGYLKIKPQGRNINTKAGDQTQSKCSIPPRVNSPCDPGSQRVYVPGPGGKREEAAAEFEVYNQGMIKTELCNKWQETGMCPYGENCQFAHGIKELRPVIRHPRYKTEVCRMVLAGDMCPYGHRCHFRHTLTDEEKLIATKYSHANAT
ncbi:hypothetical protein M9H77_05552 [Catharanthus roseus]|uniref:Uncharacterized protein n=1 Tax=Catharanthus roseus TaxID=4058 RepID=A0ACC0CHG7_CATRO|nr:hypothetical protein M9H77_05552 [Catharanthus roseus]